MKFYQLFTLLLLLLSINSYAGDYVKEIADIDVEKVSLSKKQKKQKKQTAFQQKRIKRLKIKLAKAKKIGKKKRIEEALHKAETQTEQAGKTWGVLSFIFGLSSFLILLVFFLAVLASPYFLFIFLFYANILVAILINIFIGAVLGVVFFILELIINKKNNSEKPFSALGLIGFILSTLVILYYLYVLIIFGIR